MPGIPLACLFAAVSTATGTPATVARDFYATYLRQQPFGLLVGEARRALVPFLTPRLLRVLDDAKACQDDWGRQQPKNSTDKPPFVDCCLFSSTPDGIPTSFTAGSTEAMPDGRQKVYINFVYKDPPGTYSDPSVPLGAVRWRDAVIVASLGGRYLIDDVLFIDDRPPKTEELLSKAFRDCTGGRWTGPR